MVHETPVLFGCADSFVLFVFVRAAALSCCSTNSRRNLVALLWFVAGGAVVFGYCSPEFSFLSIRVVAVDDVAAALLSSSSARFVVAAVVVVDGAQSPSKTRTPTSMPCSSLHPSRAEVYFLFVLNLIFILIVN